MEARIVWVAIAAWLLLLGFSTSAPALQQLPDVTSSISSNSTSLTFQHATVEQTDLGQWWPTAAAGQRQPFDVGQCTEPDEHIYTDNTVVENGGPSTLNGTMEIYVDAPVRITCIRIEDKATDGTGAQAWVHSGGLGESWVFIGVQTQYGKGFNFDIHLFGVPDEKRIAQAQTIV